MSENQDGYYTAADLEDAVARLREERLTMAQLDLQYREELADFETKLIPLKADIELVRRTEAAAAEHVRAVAFSLWTNGVVTSKTRPPTRQPACTVPRSSRRWHGRPWRR